MPVVPMPSTRPTTGAPMTPAQRQALLAKTVPDSYQLMAAAYMHNIGRLFPNDPQPSLAQPVADKT